MNIHVEASRLSERDSTTLLICTYDYFVGLLRTCSLEYESEVIALFSQGLYTIVVEYTLFVSFFKRSSLFVFMVIQLLTCFIIQG